jgi:hypothetical protein
MIETDTLTKQTTREFKHSLILYFRSLIFALLIYTNAWSQVTFGPEFTFYPATTNSHRNTNNGDPFDNYQSRLNIYENFNERLTTICQNLKVKCLITTWNQWGGTLLLGEKRIEINFTIDDNVFEVRVAPLTRQEFISQSDNLQRLIFDSMAQVNYLPHESIGGGHLNIGVHSGVGDNLHLLANWWADSINHFSLYSGGIGMVSPQNAPSPFDHPDEFNLDGARKVLAEVRSGQIQNIDDFWSNLRNRVYLQNPKFHAVAIRQGSLIGNPSSIETRRLEFRSFRPQQNMQRFIDEITLMEGRLNFLRTVSGSIDLINPGAKFFPTDQMLIDDFYTFVTESGLNWDDFSHLMPSRFYGTPPSRLARRYQLPPHIIQGRCETILERLQRLVF